MDDNRFGTMCVIRVVVDSEATHGDETVPAGLQGTGSTPPARDAHAGTRCFASRRGTRLRGEPADGNDLGAVAGGRSAGVAAPSARAAKRAGCGATRPIAQAIAARRGRPRLSHRAVDVGAGGQVDQAGIRPRVQPVARLAGAARSGVLGAAAGGARSATRRAGDPRLEAPALADAKKNARRQGRTIVFVDESGLSERPTRVRTWAPKGHTPVLQYSFNWKQLSLIAGVSYWRFYFRFF